MSLQSALGIRHDGQSHPIRDQQGRIILEFLTAAGGIRQHRGTFQLDSGVTVTITPAVTFATNITQTAGIHFIGDTAHANVTQGIVVNQGAADDFIIALKSSDIAHGATSVVSVGLETDDYFTIQKRTSTTGGALMTVINESGAQTSVFVTRVSGGVGMTTKTQAGAIGLVQVEVSEHNGANALSNITANGNIYALRAQLGGAMYTRFAVDEDGEGHLANTTLVALSDDLPDALVARAAHLLSGSPSPMLEPMWAGIMEETGMSKRDMAVTLEERKIMHFEWSGGEPFSGEPLPTGGMTSIRNSIYFAWDGLWQAREERKALQAQVDAVTEANAILSGKLDALALGGK
jgi:hypothetical protein